MTQIFTTDKTPAAGAEIWLGNLDALYRTDPRLAQETDDLTWCDPEGDAVNHPPASIGLAQTLRHQVEGFGTQGFSSG